MTSPESQQPRTAAGREFLHDLGTSVRPADGATGVMQKAMREQYDLDVAAIRKIEAEAAADASRQRDTLLRRLLAGIDRAAVEGAGGDFWDAVDEAEHLLAASQDDE